MTTYTDAPWYDMYMDIEYKLEETTTHLNFFEARDSILQSYATPVGEWGFRLALIALACCHRVCRVQPGQNAPQGAAGFGRTAPPPCSAVPRARRRRPRPGCGRCTRCSPSRP